MNIVTKYVSIALSSVVSLVKFIASAAMVLLFVVASTLYSILKDMGLMVLELSRCVVYFYGFLMGYYKADKEESKS